MEARSQRFRDSLAAVFGRRLIGLTSVAGVLFLVGLVARGLS